MKKDIKIIWEKGLRLLYPNTCPLCGRVTEEEICPACKNAVHTVGEPLCKKCGKPLHDERVEYCRDCRHTRHYFEEGRALWLHQKQPAWSVYQFKFHNRRIYGRFYVEKIMERFAGHIAKWRISLIIPIPLSKKKRRIRGFNQAEILAKGLEEKTGIPAEVHCFVRIRNTRPQKSLDPSCRRQNVLGAFAWTGGSLKGRNILLVDDIYTTGNTIDSAARVLKKAGAENVYFLTISIGQGY